MEAGRKSELTVSQLLNIALALRIPPVYLLAPLGLPESKLDLANLSPDFESMTVVEFEAWLSGNTTSTHQLSSAAEHRDRNQLAALRELFVQRQERERICRALDLEEELAPRTVDSELGDFQALARSRLRTTDKRIAELTS